MLNPAAPRITSKATQLLPIPGPKPLVDTIARLRLSQALNIYMRSMEISGQATTELRLCNDRPDVIIRPDLVGIGLLDRVDPLKFIVAGERAVDEVLPELRRSVGFSATIGRRYSPHFQKKIRSSLRSRQIMSYIRDLRKYAKKTDMHLIIGFFVLLIVVGLGLVFFIWGAGAAVTGLICVGVALLPVLAVLGVVWILDYLARRARGE